MAVQPPQSTNRGGNGTLKGTGKIAAQTLTTMERIHMKKFTSLFDHVFLGRGILMVAITLGGAAVLTACDRNEGPVEEAAESIDESFDSAKDAYKEGVEEMKDEYDDHTTE